MLHLLMACALTLLIWHQEKTQNR